MAISYTGKTVTGKRKRNEDSYLIHDYGNNTRLTAVADGMGGGVAGKLASETTLKTLKDQLASRINKDLGTEDLKPTLKNAIMAAQAKLADMISQNGDLNGMGTTCVAVLEHKGKMAWANIGDSRAYLFDRKKGLKRLTIDNSLVEESNDKDTSHIPDNIITRCIDGGLDEPDLYPVKQKSKIIPRNSIILLCSDGLIVGTDGDRHIEKILKSARSKKETVDMLIGDALDRGSTDNITVIVSEFGKVRKRTGSRQTIAWAGITCVLLIMVATVYLLRPDLLAFHTDENEPEKEKTSITANVSVQEPQTLYDAGMMDWVPLKSKQFEFPLTDQSRISWSYLPVADTSVTYHVIIYDHEGNSLFTRTFQHDQNALKLSEANLDTNKKQLRVRVTATLPDGTNKEGNTIEFRMR